MGNTGKPSKGCILCCKRRVKCDQTKPGCLRCERINQTCPGYANGDDTWVFRNENERARRKALRLPRKTAKSDVLKSRPLPRVKGAVSGSPASPSQRSHVTAKSVPSRQSTLTSILPPKGAQSDTLPNDAISPALAADLDFRSVCLFMDTFTLSSNSEGDDPAYQDFLPGLYWSSKPNSCLRAAVSAVAQYNFLNRYQAHDLMRTANQAYGKALALTNQALADASEALADETISAVSLLGLHELLTHNVPKPHEPSAWASHVAGTLELLRLRGPAQLSSARGRQLFRLVHAPILVKAMMMGQLPPQESIDLVQVIQQGQISNTNAAARVSVYFQKATEMRAKILELIKRRTLGIDTSNFKADMSKLVADGQNLDRKYDMKKWVADHQHWQLRSSTDGASPNSESGEDDGDYYFDSIWVMGVWVRYWGAQICMYKSLLDGLRVMKIADQTTSGRDNDLDSDQDSDCSPSTQCSQFDGAEFEQILRNAATDINRCVAFAFGDIDRNGLENLSGKFHFGSGVGALHIFWSLGVVVHSPYTTMKQRDVARAALLRVGNERGIAQACFYI